MTMTLPPAFHDPAYRRFAFLIGALLLAGAATLSLCTFILKRNVSKIWIIWRSWIIMIPIGFAVVAFGRYATIAGVILLALLAFKEYARATGLYRDLPLTLAAYLIILSIGALAALRRFDLLPLAAIGAPALLLFIPIARNQVAGQLQSLCLALLGVTLVGYLFGHLAFIPNLPAWIGPFIFLLFSVEICDIAAFTAGKTLGRHPFRSRISPNKTWEGALGGAALAMALPWLLPFALPHFTTQQKLLTGLILAIAGPLGDLSISLIKRELAIKDMGAALPGHGGILDRIDSLLLTAPLFTHLLHHL